MPNPGNLNNDPTADALKQGDFRVIAKAISLVENSKPGAEELLRNILPQNTPILGITGPPGAGKSTLVDALILHFTSQQKKLAVLCVDPSSSFHSGAFLGDRIRMNRWHDNPLVYIRSLASRGKIGGLNPRIFQITDLLAYAGFDYILIETVGVGQTEVDIARLADQVVVVLVPESGDDIQTMKSGILEIGDIFVVNKSDRPGADQFLQSLKSSILYQSTKPKQEIQFIQTIATEDKGIDAVYRAILDNVHRPDSGRALTLLTQKAWELISLYRMRDLNRETLRSSIEKEMAKPDFNIYRFAESYAGNK
jgi:LAO/AO transport system kinase